MPSKLDRIRADLARARRKQAEWNQKVKDLEVKFQETENTMIHDMVHHANLTPEELLVILDQVKNTNSEEYPKEVSEDAEITKEEM